MKHKGTGSTDGEIEAIAKIIELLMKMEAEIIEERGPLAFMSEFEPVGLVKIRVEGYVYAN